MLSHIPHDSRGNQTRLFVLTLHKASFSHSFVQACHVAGQLLSGLSLLGCVRPTCQAHHLAASHAGNRPAPTSAPNRWQLCVAAQPTQCTVTQLTCMHALLLSLAGNGPAPTSVRLADGSCVVRRIIPSDNSCLFTAVGYVMEHDRGRAAALRQVIAEVVAADPGTRERTICSVQCVHSMYGAARRAQSTAAALFNR
jgi:hypothetical protein